MKIALWKCLLSAALAANVLVPGVASAQPAEPGDANDKGTQWWKGAFEAQGMTLDFVVVFRPTSDPGRFTATIDIPVQGAKDVALSDVVLDADQLGFVIPPPPGAPATVTAIFELQRDKDGCAANGTLKQSGFTFAVRMERITEDLARAVGPQRPQTPKPPFPYEAREVTYENPVDHTRLTNRGTTACGISRPRR